MIRAILRKQEGPVQTEVPASGFKEALADPANLLWVDIENPEDAEIELLLEVFELHPLTIEDCILPNTRPKLENFDRYLFVVLQGLSRENGNSLRTVELNLCVGPNFLVTVRSEQMKCIDADWTRVAKKSPICTRGADFLLYAITDSLIDSYFPFLDEVEAKVDALEAKLLSNSTQEMLKELFRVYDELVVLRRALAPHREILTRISRRDDLPLIKTANAAYFRDIYDHLLRMSDLVDTCRETTTMLLEAYSTIVSNRLNEIMKTMTALATLSIPFVIITGIYGMNFGEHPWIPVWAFHAVSVMLLVSMPFMFWYFRKFRWL